MSKNIFTVLQDMYDSEINFEIVSFWDGGFEVNLGDKTNGFKWSNVYYTIEEGVFELAKQAVKYYPKSIFAKWAENEYFIVKHKINDIR